MIFFFKLLTTALFGVLIFSSCGKRRPPLPPIERVPQRVVVDGRQVGDQVDLVWKMPARNAPKLSSLQISRIDVYRLAEKLSEPLSLTEKEFADRSTLIGSVKVDDSDFGLKELSFSDKLKVAGQPVRLRYAVRLANLSGQKAAFSNFFLIEPIANVGNAPKGLVITVTQTEVSLEWTPPATNLDLTSPPNILGYNIYRSEGTDSFRQLNTKPITRSAFSDNSFRFGTEYKYFLRTVSLGRNAEEVESFASETVGVVPEDAFKPAPPDALTIASAPSVISIFFAFNTEQDIAGYNIYRSEDASLPKGQWQLMNDDLLKTNSFQDKTVAAGITYYYFVVAIDTVGNTSDSSEVVSDNAL